MQATSKSFHYRRGGLHCEGVALEEIAGREGTPCFVYSRASLLANLKQFETGLKDVRHRTFFAVKANSNLSILRLLAETGCGFDVVSAGELDRVERIGVEPGRIIFGGVGKTQTELQSALRRPLFCLNVESLQELERLSALASNSDSLTSLGLRINPDIEVPTHPYIATGRGRHKFGLSLEAMERAFSWVRKQSRFELVSVGCHIGSQILDGKPFELAFYKLLALADQLRADGFEIQNIDLGGGFGIPKEDEAPFDLESLASLLRERQGDYRILFEPGRFLVGSAGILVTRVLYRKTNQGKLFLVVDAGMNDFMRPTLYGAHHGVRAVADGVPKVRADLVGPVCESGDFFALDRYLPDVRPDDLLILENTGAYGSVLSHNYNTRRRPAEILVEGDSYRVIRRREIYDDLVRLEEIEPDRQSGG